MDITHDGKFERTDMWREGEWLDLWSVVHFLTGLSLGFAFYAVHIGTVTTVAVVLVGLISYEMWEAFVGIIETPMNRSMDVVVGMVSFLIVFFFVAPRLVSATQYILTFVLVLTANILMSVFGWIASQKAAELEKRVRARYARQRMRLLNHTRRLREKFKRPHSGVNY